MKKFSPITGKEKSEGAYSGSISGSQANQELDATELEQQAKRLLKIGKKIGLGR